MSGATPAQNGSVGPQPVTAPQPMTEGLTLVLPAELLDVIARRVAELIEERPATSDGWLRGAVAIGEYIGAPESRVHALSSAGRIPVERDGTALVAKRSTLDAWIRGGGGLRP